MALKVKIVTVIVSEQTNSYLEMECKSLKPVANFTAYLQILEQFVVIAY